ncbi:hypothetical protein NM688_g117 [Phlebia brevispora]|uniref:Uncharacterized protein n=1 Tax=Phlebia brevispora TaxID=194682 RepID=A0ACC1TFH1_9APHY|nr:hypothetical protein NM688_g117 [Phlebia brevispora]
MPAVLQFQGSLVHNLWGPRYCQLHPASRDEVSEQDIFPSDVESFVDWARILCNPFHADRSYRYTVIHAPKKDAHEPRKMEHVVFHVQGIVKKLNLKDTGTWNKSFEHAPKAIQYVGLGPTSDKTAFDAQLQAVDNIRGILSEVLNRRIMPVHRAPDELYLRKKVFNRTKFLRNPRSVISHKDPNFYAAERIATEWMAVDQIEVGERMSDGTVRACDQSSVRVGDFVDVSVIIQVRSYSDDGSGEGEMHLCIRQVVVLNRDGLARTHAVHGDVIMNTDNLELVTTCKYKLSKVPTPLVSSTMARQMTSSWSSGSSDSDSVVTPVEHQAVHDFLGWNEGETVGVKDAGVEGSELDDSALLSDFDFESEMTSFLVDGLVRNATLTRENIVRTSVTIVINQRPIGLCGSCFQMHQVRTTPTVAEVVELFRIRGIRYLSKAVVEYLQREAHGQADGILPMYCVPSDVQWHNLFAFPEIAPMNSQASGDLCLVDGGLRDFVLEGVTLRKADMIALSELLRALSSFNTQVIRWSRLRFTAYQCCSREPLESGPPHAVLPIDFTEEQFMVLQPEDLVLVHFYILKATDTWQGGNLSLRLTSFRTLYSPMGTTQSAAVQGGNSNAGSSIAA